MWKPQLKPVLCMIQTSTWSWISHNLSKHCPSDYCPVIFLGFKHTVKFWWFTEKKTCQLTCSAYPGRASAGTSQKKGFKLIHFILKQLKRHPIALQSGICMLNFSMTQLTHSISGRHRNSTVCLTAQSDKIWTIQLKRFNKQPSPSSQLPCCCS